MQILQNLKNFWLKKHSNKYYQHRKIISANTIYKISGGTSYLYRTDKVFQTLSANTINIEEKCITEVNKMSSSNNSGSNRMEVPEAKAAMDRFKTEVASELGVPLKEGYNGDLTSAQAGSIGGEMVKKMIRAQEEQMMSK